jgi:hypothetical protein
MNPDITAEMSPNGVFFIQGIEYCFIDDDLATAKNEKSSMLSKPRARRVICSPIQHR